MKLFRKLFIFIFVLFGLFVFACASKTEESKDNPTDNPSEKTQEAEDVKFTLDGIKEEVILNSEFEFTANGIELSKLHFDLNGDSIEIENGKVKAVKVGTTIVKVTAEGSKTEITFSIEVKEEPVISITGSSEINLGEESQLLVNIKNKIDGDDKIEWATSDKDVATVKDGLVTATGSGSCTITATYLEKYTATFEITVRSLVQSISFNVMLIELEMGDTFQTAYTVNPKTLTPEVEYSSSDDSVATVDENGLITAVNGGEVIITVKALDGSEKYSEMSVIIEDNEKPVVTYKTTQNIKVAWNTVFDPLADITVTDNVDGDITSKVQVTQNDVNTEVYGTYLVKYKATDSSGNKLQFNRQVEVYWPYSVNFIGHAGSYYGVMNSEEAIRYALETLHYQCIEIDLAQTSDGVFVLSHDATFGDYTIASTPWSTFQNYSITKGRTGGYPTDTYGSPYTTKLCLLSTYLDLCKKYGAKAVIELKSSKGISNSDCSRMPALMDEIKKHGMLDDTIFLASQKQVLQWVRDNGYTDMELQYLVGSCESQTSLDYCIKYNIDISINVTYGDYSNSKEWRDKYHAAGLKISTYTFTQYCTYAQVQEWINNGVDYVTCDWHKMTELKLPYGTTDYILFE